MPRIDRETNDVAESGSCPTVWGFMKSSVKSVKNGELPEVWMRFLNALSGEQTVEEKGRKRNGTRRTALGAVPAGGPALRPRGRFLPASPSSKPAGQLITFVALVPVTTVPREPRN